MKAFIIILIMLYFNKYSKMSNPSHKEVLTKVLHEKLSANMKGKFVLIEMDKKKEEKMPVVREHKDYDAGPVESCKAVNGPGVGKPCVFPFIVLGKSHSSCTLAGGKDVHKFWCSTKVDYDGTHVKGNWGDCSKDCPGVGEQGISELTCDTLKPGTTCRLPFSYKGRNYTGCVRESEKEKYWCFVNETTKNGRKVKCSRTCPKDNLLATLKLSPEEIISQLKEKPKVFSKIEEGENCADAVVDKNMTEICLGASYCSPEKMEANEKLKVACGGFQLIERNNESGLGFPLQIDCHFACGTDDM